MSGDCAYTFEPAAHPDSSVTDTWHCPHDALADAAHCPFHASPTERRQHGVTPEDVTSRLVSTLSDSTDRREFVGAHIPALSLTRMTIQLDTQYPIDLRHTTIPGGITAEQAQIDEQVDLRHSTVGGFDATGCEFEDGIQSAHAVFTDHVRFTGADIYQADADFTGAVFEADAVFDSTSFGDNVSFADATFEAAARFDATRFYGQTRSMGDTTDFSGVQFVGTATFDRAILGRGEFSGVRFDGAVSFTRVTADGDLDLSQTRFADSAIFRELTADGDVDLSGAVFEHEAVFTGARFNGGADVAREDLRCSEARFDTTCEFDQAIIGNASFAEATFSGSTSFERAEFTEQAEFARAVFEETADFDEVIFDGDTAFSHVEFEGDVDFRGSEFHGSTDYLSDDVSFAGTTFHGNAAFQDTRLATADITEVTFEGDANFRNTVVEELSLYAYSLGDDTYIDFTEAQIDSGSITQPADGWVRVDLTDATLGDVELTAKTVTDERELLDYFRFCDTRFDGFTFSAHTDYLDRNNWTLHSFDAGEHDDGYAVTMTPQVIERTYLKAKTSASAMGENKAAGEFRVKRQRYARQKFLDIATDSAEDLKTRLRNGVRALENAFLGVTCGYGLRLYRIAAVFVLVPLVVGFLYAFGGDAFATSADQVDSLSALTTRDGLETLAINVYFSYITFLTIGYGNIGPTGMAARFVSAALVYLNVILGGLFLYALIKRSEV